MGLAMDGEFPGILKFYQQLINIKWSIYTSFAIRFDALKRFDCPWKQAGNFLIARNA